MARRWLIDAMNVIGSRPDKWWNDPDKAMWSLAVSLDEYAGITGDEVTVVFDRPPKPAPDVATARLAYAARRGRNAADHEIVEMIARDSDPSSLRVVTSDKALRDRVTELGARLMSSGAFRDRVDRTLAAEQ